MQLYPILIVAVLLAADGPLRLPVAAGPAVALAVALGGPVAVVLVSGIGLRVARRRLARGDGRRGVILADGLVRAGRTSLLLVHAAACLLTGWLAVIREVTGDVVFVDEAIALVPPLAGLVALWWLYYPVERRLRDALQVRRLDLGLPLHATPSRGRFVLQQARLNLMLLLVPVLVILALSEAVPTLMDRLGPADAPRWVSEVVTFAAALLVFLLAPFIARIVLSVEPVADGPLRAALLDVCRHHRVRVRDVLLWRTDGLMINAAVMGLLGRLRYVLLTDGLVELMTRDEVVAVMAHEIGHVRRHHMPWLVLSLMAMLLLGSLAVGAPFYALQYAGVTFGPGLVPWIDAAITIGSAIVGLIAFGWISRRYERQADTFAVQHLSRLAPAPAQERPTVTPVAVDTMHDALQTISRLNNVAPHRPSWRHGSIAWRQAYLRSLVGRPLERLPIDRLVRAAKVVVLAVLLSGATVLVLIDRVLAPAPPDAAAPNNDGPRQAEEP